MKTYFVSYRLDFDKHFLSRLKAVRHELSLIGTAWTDVPQFAVISCNDDTNPETVESALYRGGFDASRDTMNIFEGQLSAMKTVGDAPDYPPPPHFS